MQHPGAPQTDKVTLRRNRGYLDWDAPAAASAEPDTLATRGKGHTQGLELLPGAADTESPPMPQRYVLLCLRNVSVSDTNMRLVQMDPTCISVDLEINLPSPVLPNSTQSSASLIDHRYERGDLPVGPYNECLLCAIVRLLS